MDKLTFALNQLDNRRDTLADNLNQKGVSASRTETLETLVPKVLEIEGGGGSSGWQPEPDWWDVETMVETGVLEWNGQSVDNVRAGFVVIDAKPTTTLAPNHEYYLSDGSYYNVGDTAIVHTWDRSHDKFCDLGYSTRSVIIVKDDRQIDVTHRAFSMDGVVSIYIYLGDCEPTMWFGSATLSNANTALLSVGFSENISYFSTRASLFYNCTSLQHIALPDNLTRLENYTFRGCKSITQITIPESVTSVGQDVFRECTSLQQITIPNNIISMGDYFLTDSTSLHHITFGDSLRNFGVSCLNGCSNVKYLTIKSPNASLGTNLSSMTSLQSVTVPQNFNSNLRIYTSPDLSPTSLEKIIENYADRSSTTALTFTISTANKAKLSQDYLDLAASKNITIATA